MQDEFLTASGRKLSVPISTRLELPAYQKLALIASKEGKSLSSFCKNVLLAAINEKGVTTNER